MNPEGLIRLGIFVTVLAACAIAQQMAPKRKFSVQLSRRWFNNFAIGILDVVLLRIALPSAAIAVAVAAEGKNWGLFNHFGLSAWVSVPLTVLLFDFLIYVQHMVFHHVPILWRLHQVHHTDQDLDVSSALRFHPVEILISMLIKMAAVAVLGTPAAGVLAFEIVLNATAMFNHSNLELPGKLDAVLRLFLVTPDMHRIHHSVRSEETNSNYGFSLPWWDRLCGTYRAQPRDGHQGMRIGLEEYRDERPQRFAWLMALPFLKKQD